jgi:adenine-specific DNA-methyltransferase
VRTGGETSIEARRLALQRELDAAKTQKERNRLGQFATPTTLASDVLAFARTLLPADEPIRFLDPAVGTGSFYAALLNQFPAGRIEAAAGIEIDPHYGKPALKLWKDSLLKMTLGDFTTMNAPGESKRFNLIICNPPYVRHHHMDKAEKARLLAATAAACGVRMGGLAGLYCHFLGLADAWLAEDGIAGWLIPSEFMDVNYGQAVKRYLLERVDLLRIHRFDPNDLQFGDALVSTAVVWFRKRRAGQGRGVVFSYGGTLASPTHTREVPTAALRSAAKWSSLAASGIKATNGGFRLADFFSVKRGLATGDNGFFIMSREEIEARRLPAAFFKPILPGPRYLESDVIEADDDGVPKIEHQRFMLDCRLSESEIKALHPALWEYLETGKPRVAETYLCRHRKPWYAQETRPPAPFICTYMGRGLAKRAKPFRFFLNLSAATAANVYLLLYPKPLVARALTDNPELAWRVWKFLDSIPSESLLGEGRVYGGGLYKMEPKELGNVPADEIAALMPPAADRPASQVEMFN